MCVRIPQFTERLRWRWRCISRFLARPNCSWAPAGGLTPNLSSTATVFSMNLTSKSGGYSLNENTATGQLVTAGALTKDAASIFKTGGSLIINYSRLGVPVFITVETATSLSFSGLPTGSVTFSKSSNLDGFGSFDFFLTDKVSEKSFAAVYKVDGSNQSKYQSMDSMMLGLTAYLLNNADDANMATPTADVLANAESDDFP